MTNFILAATLLTGCSEKSSATKSTETIQMNSKTPAISAQTELERHDGKEITIIGTFRKSMTKRKMGGTGTFLGEAHIEMDNGFIVDIGKRDSKDFESYTDATVRVTGKLRFDPYKEDRESDAIHARVIFGHPQLNDIVRIEKQN